MSHLPIHISVAMLQCYKITCSPEWKRLLKMKDWGSCGSNRMGLQLTQPELSRLTPYPAICVNVLYETSKNDSNSVLQLTAAILLTSFSEHKNSKWYVMPTSRIINFPLYVLLFIFYFSSKLLNRFCPTLYKG